MFWTHDLVLAFRELWRYKERGRHSANDIYNYKDYRKIDLNDTLILKCKMACIFMIADM